MNQVLRQERRDGVLLLTLYRPQSRNALNRALIVELDAAMDIFIADDSVSVAVITGADPAFCAGLDLRELSEKGAPSMGGGEMINRLGQIDKPVIGAVNGSAVTGGLELALACDFLIASDRAVFADTHARVGVLPGGGLSARLPQAVGQRFARQMSFAGDFVGAARALEVGLVNEVVPHEQLLERAFEVAGAVAANDASLIGALKALYVRGSSTSFADALELEGQAAGARRSAGQQYARDPSAVISRGRQQNGAIVPSW